MLLMNRFSNPSLSKPAWHQNLASSSGLILFAFLKKSKIQFNYMYILDVSYQYYICKWMLFIKSLSVIQMVLFKNLLYFNMICQVILYWKLILFNTCNLPSLGLLLLYSSLSAPEIHFYSTCTRTKKRKMEKLYLHNTVIDTSIDHMGEIHFKSLVWF